MEKVIRAFDTGSPKQQAAVYLADHIAFHHHLSGDGIDLFRQGLDSCKTRDKINELWHTVNDGKAKYKDDNNNLEPDYLIDDINQAFEIWNKVPWKKDVSFGIFCRYILPYKITNEPLTRWREYLHEIYYPHVKHLDNTKEAFEVIYNLIYENFVHDNYIRFSYTMDPIMLDKIKRGKCSDRSMYILAVMKALCIPAVYDITPYWANYSNSGHGWVSFIDAQENTCLANRFTDEFSHLYIDATFIQPKHHINAFNGEHSVDSLKKMARIFRYTYEIVPKNPAIIHWKIPGYLKHPYRKDVTGEYPLKQNAIDIPTAGIQTDLIALCNFNHTLGWYPVAMEKNGGAHTRFESVVEGVVYLPAKLTPGGVEPISNPFIFRKNNREELNPDLSKHRTVTLRRKYLTWTFWTNRWEDIHGCTFEVADDRRFTENRDTLALITRVSASPMEFEVDSKRPYRFIRFRSRKGQNAPIVEWEIYNEKGERITGRTDGRAVEKDQIANAFDGDFSTAVFGKEDYWMSLDFGENHPQTIKRIRLKLADDGNFIEPGNNYELFYYDMGWKSMGSIRPSEDSVSFAGVPANALLWLRNKSKGKEERIFTYQEGRQIWW
ncbi:MAG: hypothetical protein LUD68_07260 [Rikenellaceae bacterium]|nr:hypothetical protein [Rikenellaceae bacterium]